MNASKSTTAERSHPMSATPNKTAIRKAGFAMIALSSLALAACAQDRVVQTGSIYPYDYRDRHPIVLSEKPQHLDIFVRGAELDQRQKDDIQSFAALYLAEGRGRMTAQIPSGIGGADRTFAAVRAVLAEAGIPGNAVSRSHYEPRERGLAAPIRLTMHKMKATVDSRCGLWPQDLGVSDPGFNMRNEPYWNHGCATQSNMAAQIADPVDLVRGRSAGDIDTARRTAAVRSLREGKDPSTTYRQDGRRGISGFGN